MLKNNNYLIDKDFTNCYKIFINKDYRRYYNTIKHKNSHNNYKLNIK